MTVLTRFRFFLWYFGRFQVPLIGHLRPKLMTLTDESIVVKLPLKRRSKNHLNSMYFGALAVGADLAGGFHGFYHAKAENRDISLAFKSFQAQFIKRPESDVYFVSQEGNTVKSMIQQSASNGERVNKMVLIQAFTHYPEQPELVADFQLELSVKILNKPIK